MKRVAPASVRRQKKVKVSKTTAKLLSDDDAIGAETDGPSLYKAPFEALKNEVKMLSAEVLKQQTIIGELTTQMSFVTSWLENSVTPEACSAAFKDFATAVKRPTAVANRAAQESVVAAVYVDNQRRENRATNFIVSGLVQSDIRPDQLLVVDLCRREFGEMPDIVHCKRLGKVVSGRIQPLLVVLKTAAQAVRFVAEAKRLRQSTDPTTQQSIYIAANLTKAESRAAFEVRCARRQAAERRRKMQLQEQHQQLSIGTSGFNSITSPRRSQQLQQSQTLSIGQQRQHNVAASNLGHTGHPQLQQMTHTMTVAAEIHQPPPARLAPPPPPQQRWCRQQQPSLPPVMQQASGQPSSSLSSQFVQQHPWQPSHQRSSVSALQHDVMAASQQRQQQQLSATQTVVADEPVYHYTQYQPPLQQSQQQMTSTQHCSGVMADGMSMSSRQQLDPSAAVWSVPVQAPAYNTLQFDGTSSCAADGSGGVGFVAGASCPGATLNNGSM